MSTPELQVALPAPALRFLAATPHRLLFFVGATNVLLAMIWWAAWLVDARWHVVGLAHPHVYGGWLHATVMQYQVLPAFMFGFLLTVFPRWMNQPALPFWHYVPIGIGLLGGQLLTLVGALGFESALHAGAVLTLVGWAIGLLILGQLIWRDAARTLHAVSCHIALCFGWFGFLLYATFLHGADAAAMFASIKMGTFGLLLPIYFTVCHRMIPFFTGSVFSDYRPFRPMWTLAAFCVLALLHLWLELAHGYARLWIVDPPLAALCFWLLWKWRPRRKMPPLLRVLFIGFAWLPIALTLYAAQSAWLAATGEFALGRAPAHALFIGCFGSLLVAMVTRATQGHSGRPLVLGTVGGVTFALLQLVALLRIAVEFETDSLACQAVVAGAWVAAFLPWVARSVWIYLTPRKDSRAG